MAENKIIDLERLKEYGQKTHAKEVNEAWLVHGLAGTEPYSLTYADCVVDSDWGQYAMTWDPSLTTHAVEFDGTVYNVEEKRPAPADPHFLNGQCSYLGDLTLSEYPFYIVISPPYGGDADFCFSADEGTHIVKIDGVAFDPVVIDTHDDMYVGGSGRLPACCAPYQYEPIGNLHITFDGVDYDLSPVDVSYSSTHLRYAFGNLNLRSSDYADTGEPFYCEFCEVSNPAIYNRGFSIYSKNGLHSVSYEAIKPIADTVLPDRYITVRNPNGTGTLIMNGSVINPDDHQPNTYGSQAIALGAGSSAGGLNSFAAGYAARADANNAVAIGYGTNVTGGSGVAIGTYAKVSGECGFAEGYKTTASGKAAHAEGYNTKATNMASHAEGMQSQAENSQSHAEGYNTLARGARAHAEGYQAQAIGNDSHAEGNGTHATGTQSHAEGQTTWAQSVGSHAEGTYTKTSTTLAAQHVQGKYNSTTYVNDYADVVGWGTGDIESNRKNIEATTTTGNKKMKGDVYVHAEDDSTGGIMLSTPDVLAPYFSTSTAYAAGAFVTNKDDGKLYKAKADIAAGPWDSTKWDATSVTANMTGSVTYVTKEEVEAMIESVFGV